MLFGQSVFQSVLTRLDEEAEEDGAQAEVPSFRVTGLGSGFVAQTEEATAYGHAGVSDAYLDLLLDAPLPPEPEAQAAAAADPPQPPEHLLRLKEAEIAEDLGLKSDDTAQTLAEKRRRFARDNHPDLVAEMFRDNATLRMKTANLLIDRAIRDLYWRSS